MRFTSLTTALALGAAAIGAASYAQSSLPDVTDPQATFRSAIDIVRLDVSALDKDRVPIRGLTAADFTVLEDGKPQPIVVFDAVDVPDGSLTGTGERRNVVPDGVANRIAAQRVIAIIIKDVRVPLEPWSINITKEIARSVVEHMGPVDVASVAYAFNRDKGQEFTGDRALLLAAIDRFTVSFADATLIANPNSASERGRQSDPFANAQARRPGPAAEVCPNDECVTQALRDVAETVRRRPGGRKTVVLISPFGRTATMETRSSAGQNDELRQTFVAMQEANVNLYQFDPRGLLVSPVVHTEQFGALANDTGGRAIANSNTPQMLVPQLFRESGSYYLIGFRSTNPKNKGEFRRLEVRVTRPEVEARTRSGYYAPTTAHP